MSRSTGRHDRGWQRAAFPGPKGTRSLYSRKSTHLRCSACPQRPRITRAGGNHYSSRIVNSQQRSR